MIEIALFSVITAILIICLSAKMKKIIAIILITVCLTTMLVGCAKTRTTSSQEVVYNLLDCEKVYIFYTNDPLNTLCPISYTSNKYEKATLTVTDTELILHEQPAGTSSNYYPYSYTYVYDRNAIGYSVTYKEPYSR